MEEDQKQIIRSPILHEDEELGESKRLELAEIKVYGTSVMTLFDSGAIPNVMSATLHNRPYRSVHHTKRRRTNVDNNEALVVGEVLSVPIIIGSIKAEVSCLVVRAGPYDLIITRPSMNKLRASLDFDTDVAFFRHDIGVTRIPLLTKGWQASSSWREAFTSDDEEDETEYETDEGDSENDSSHELFLTLF